MSKAGDALMRVKDSLVVVIDVQEKFAPAIAGMERVVRNCAVLLEAAKRLKVPAFASEQYPEALGRTLPELRLALEDTDAYFPKKCFSVTGCEPILTRISLSRRRQILLCGVEAHVCVMQSALSLLDKSYQVVVVADAVGSRRDYDRDMAMRRMEKNGVELVTTEMVVFEWLKTAGTPEFKDVQKLIK